MVVVISFISVIVEVERHRMPSGTTMPKWNFFFSSFSGMCIHLCKKDG